MSPKLVAVVARRHQAAETTTVSVSIAGVRLGPGWTRGGGDPKSNNVASDVIFRSLNKAQAGPETENVPEWDTTTRAHTTTTASQRRKTEEDAWEEEEDVELRMPGSFDFADHGGGGE